MRLRELPKRVELVQERAGKLLVESMLPSPFGGGGKGWQERWFANTHAGFYASCDGITLLSSNLVLNSLSLSEKAVIEAVYQRHLCRVIDESKAANGHLQHSMRVECRVITTKMASFLRASSVVRDLGLLDPKGEALAEETFCRLLEVGNRNTGVWPFLLEGASRSDVAPTAEAAIALAAWDVAGSGDCISHSMRWLERQARKQSASWVVVLAWTLMQLSSPRAWTVFAEAVLPMEWERLDFARVFFNGPFGKGDYFHYDVQSLLSELVFGYLSIIPCKHQAIGRVLDKVEAVLEDIEGSGVYPSSEPEGRFWQYHQAVRMLSLVGDAISTMTGEKEIPFMRVTPRHFRRHEFACDAKMVTVLMPFGPEWSGDVFSTIKNAAIDSGLPNVWRSDLEYGEDLVVQTIWEKINEARVVVADCTAKNPNVFYELGIAHTIGKPVFICAQEHSDFPFDISPIRSYAYGQPTPSRLADLADRFRRFVEQEVHP